jgi:hypothetical protein
MGEKGARRDERRSSISKARQNANPKLIPGLPYQ